MNTLKNFVAALFGKNHYEPKSERVRRSVERRRKKFRRQLTNFSIVTLAIAVTFATSGFVVADSSNVEPAVPTPAATRYVLNTISASDLFAMDAMPLSLPAKSIAQNEEPVEEKLSGVTTTRLGVYVDSYDADVDYSALIDELTETLKGTDDDELKMHLIGLMEIYETKRNLKVDDLYQGSKYKKTNIFTNENTLEDIENILFPEPELEPEPLHTSYFTYTEADAIALARIVYAEAGSSWITDEHQRAVASVVMNRVLDSRFPDTISGVVNAPGQYPGTCKNLKYDQRCLDNAIYVLENGPTHNGIFQANFIQGTQILTVYEYPGYSLPTYICK